MTEYNGIETDSAERFDADVESPGELLRKRREELGIPLGVVAESLHLTVHYVKSLENDEYSKLPGLTFVKGYFKSYARYLNMDVGRVLDAYEHYVRQMGDQVAEQELTSRIRKRNDQVQLWAMIAGGILVAGLVLGWWLSQQDSGPVAAEQAPVAAVPARTAPPETVPVPELPQTATETETAMEMEMVMEEPAVEELADPEPSQETDTGLELTSSPVAAMQESDTPDEDQESRQVALPPQGDDALQIHFSGPSWVEVEDANHIRLYNDLMNSGDELVIQGMAPFYILLGDATQVEISLNQEPMAIDSRVRTDKTARFELSENGARRWAVP